MNIHDKFDKGINTHTYTRIDSEYKVNIYLGYNSDGQMSMAVVEHGKSSFVKPSKYIDVKLEKRDDGKLALYFDLLDVTYKSMYILFCKDMISVCEKAGCAMAISSALVRWNYWKEMFGRKKQNILDKMEIKGLIGELLELRDHFMEELGDSKAVSGWMGPLMGHKDFEIDDTWYEVKAVSENSIQVKISSLEQLDSDKEGHLVVIRLEETGTVSNDAINLNMIVSSVADKISDPEIFNLFINKLDNIGYSFNEEYDNICFLYKGKEYYKVTDGFPRIVRNQLDSSIGNVTYTILLAGINEFREE